MRDFTKRKIGGDLAEEQSRQKKPIVVRPLPLRASAKLPQGADSSFQLWQKPSWNGLGISETSSGAAKPYLQLATTSNSAPAEDDNNQNIENSTPHPAEDNPTNGGGATFGAANDDNTAKTGEAQVDQPGSGSNTQSEMDPRKLRRIMANRLSAQRSRLKRNEYVADLESKAKSCQNKIAFLHPEIAAQKSQQRLLQIEQHKLKLQLAAREKQRILQEVAIEKNRAEVNMLSELHRKLVAEAQARMLNLGAAMKLMSNSNLNPSGLGRLVCPNSDQALNGVETSKMLVDTAQHPQNQSQAWMAKWNNGQRSIPNFNLVKSEPES